MEKRNTTKQTELVNEIRLQLHNQKKQTQTLTNQLNSLQSHYDQLSRKSAEQQDTIKSLRAENTFLKTENRGLTFKMTHLEKEIKIVLDHKTTLTDYIKKLEIKLSLGGQNFTDAQDDLNRETQYQGVIQGLQRDIEALMISNEELNLIRQNNTEELTSLEVQNSQLRKLLDEKQQEIQEFMMANRQKEKTTNNSFEHNFSKHSIVQGQRKHWNEGEERQTQTSKQGSAIGRNQIMDRSLQTSKEYNDNPLKEFEENQITERTKILQNFLVKLRRTLSSQFNLNQVIRAIDEHIETHDNPSILVEDNTPRIQEKLHPSAVDFEEDQSVIKVFEGGSKELSRNQTLDFNRESEIKVGSTHENLHRSGTKHSKGISERQRYSAPDQYDFSMNKINQTAQKAAGQFDEYYEQLMMDYEKLQGEYDKLREKNLSLNQQVVSLKLELQEANIKISKHVEQIEQVNRSKTEFQKQFLEQISTLRRDNQKLGQENEKLGDFVKTLRKENDVLSEALARQEKLIQTYQ